MRAVELFFLLFVVFILFLVHFLFFFVSSFSSHRKSGHGELPGDVDGRARRLLATGGAGLVLLLTRNFNRGDSGIGSAPVVIESLLTSGSILLVLSIGVIIEVRNTISRLEILQEVGNWLLALQKNLDQLRRKISVLLTVERSGDAFISDTGSAT